MQYHLNPRGSMALRSHPLPFAITRCMVRVGLPPWIDVNTGLCLHHRPVQHRYRRRDVLPLRRRAVWRRNGLDGVLTMVGVQLRAAL